MSTLEEHLKQLEKICAEVYPKPYISNHEFTAIARTALPLCLEVIRKLREQRRQNLVQLVPKDKIEEFEAEDDEKILKILESK